MKKFIFFITLLVFANSSFGSELSSRKAEETCAKNQESLHLFIKEWNSKDIAGFWVALEKQLTQKKPCSDGAYGEDDTIPNSIINKWKYISEVSKTSNAFQNKLINSISATLGGEPLTLYNLSSKDCPSTMLKWCLKLKTKCISVLKEQQVKF